MRCPARQLKGRGVCGREYRAVAEARLEFLGQDAIIELLPQGIVMSTDRRLQSPSHHAAKSTQLIQRRGIQILGQHGPATSWLKSVWPCNGTPVAKAFILVGVHCLSQCDAVSRFKTARTVDKVRKTAQTKLRMLIIFIYRIPGKRVKFISYR
jgi:hypothetical protein